MNKAVKLLNLWADFEENHQGAEIEDFCRFLLIKERSKQKSGLFSGTAKPTDNLSTLAKLTGRISRLHNSYAVIVLKECGLTSIDDFIYLNEIKWHNQIQKTKVINFNFNELSSGLLVLDRLKRKQLIAEEENANDRRSKTLTITAKGEKVLKNCYEKLNAIHKLFFNKMSEDDVLLCIHLLSGTEEEFAGRWMTDKNKTFDELF